MRNIVCFSIVILTYNEERNITFLLDSLRNINAHYSTEILLIDSCSEDKTVELSKSFSSKIRNLRIFQIRKDEFNHAKTRNLAVRLSRGEYVCFVSADAVPLNDDFLRYFIEDFGLDRKVVAVYGRQIPREDSPLFQKIETLCRFEKLDKHANKQGIFIQGKKRIKGNMGKDSFFYYSLFNTFACYRKEFLLKNPFTKTNCFEDLLMGKFIFDQGLTKIYDRRCVVRHSHHYDIVNYYRSQKRDFSLQLYQLAVKQKSNALCKIKKILKMRMGFLRKLYHLSELSIYYLVKLFALIEVKTSKTIEKYS